MRPSFYPILIVLVLGGVYSVTLAPDLTWAHFSADGGDLIAATFVNGVPHPAGYPLYLILAKCFQLLPFGSLPFRTNVLSAVCTVLAALTIFELIGAQVKESPFQNQLALLGALAYGLAPAAWAQALVTEVYALHGLLVALCLYVFLKPEFPEWARGLVFGLAASNHVTSVLLFPLLFLYGDGKKIGLRLAGAFSGLLLYLTLPLRAAFHPPVNWGDPSTLSGFIWLVSGAAYRGYAFDLPFTDFIGRLQSASELALDQFTAPGLFCAFYGLFLLRPSRTLLATLWSALAFLFFSTVYASYDSRVYLIVVWLCIAIWLPLGLGDLLQNIHDSRAPRLARVLPIAALALLLLRIPLTLPKVDLSSDTQAQDFIAAALAEIPEGALVFVTGDEQIFSLWYAQFALQRRGDMIVIAEGLLQFEWYHQNLKVAYPFIVTPEKDSLQPFDLIVVNPRRSICYVSPDAIRCR